MKFVEWLKGREETRKIAGAKVTYSDVVRAVKICEWDKTSRDCKEELKKLGIEDKAPEFGKEGGNRYEEEN